EGILAGGEVVEESKGSEIPQVEKGDLLFLSSRGRHTRLVSNWSSDVCSSDLTAPHRPLDAFRWLRPRRTGAACTRFCVKTAAALAGNPLTISAKSSFSTCRIPAYVAAYAYP